MKIFADTGMLDEIKQAASWGILDGVTTNPSLIKKAVEGLKEAGKDISMKEYIEEILKTAGKGKPVSLEVVSTTEDEMVAEARKLFETFNRVAENVVVKIPVNPTTSDDSAHTYDGLRAIKKLSSQGIPINTTLIMNPTQALLAAKAGATYVSPFAGRIDDYLRRRAGLTFEKGDYFDVMGLVDDETGEIVDDNGMLSGVHLVETIADIFNIYSIESEIIGASVRNVRQAVELALTGCHIATIPFKVIEEMMNHPKTMEGVVKFGEDTVPEYRAIFG